MLVAGRRSQVAGLLRRVGSHPENEYHTVTVSIQEIGGTWELPVEASTVLVEFHVELGLIYIIA